MIGFLVGFLVFYFIVSYLLNRKFTGGKSERITDPTGRKLEMWGSVGIAIAGVIGLYVMYAITDWSPGKEILWFFAFYWTLHMGFRAFLERKYLPGSKQYWVSLILLILSLGYMAVLSFLA